MNDDFWSQLGSVAGVQMPGEGAPDVTFGRDERYTDEMLIGLGGMGRVVSVRDTHLGRVVARKTPRSGEAGVRLAREALITARLEHPGIVTVFDAGIDENGLPFYTMQLHRGRSLHDALTDCGDLKARLIYVRHLLRAAQAMAYAHEHGVIHRDLKPHNLMVGTHGEAQVVDWGLARSLSDDPALEARTAGPETPTEDPLETQAGAVLGTAAYSSPELSRGEPADKRSDVWGLGAVLYELLHGEPPFPADTATGTVTRTTPPVANLGPPELCAIANRCLRSDPDDRYGDANGVATDLEAWLDGRRVDAHAYTNRELLTRLAWQYRRVIAGTGLVALMALSGAVVAGVLITGERDRALDAEGAAKLSFERAERSLAQVLAQSAQAALSRHDLPTAEFNAARSLEHAPLSRARGVLAALPPSGPFLVSKAECQRVSVADDGVFCDDGTNLVLLSPGALEPEWSIPTPEKYGELAWVDGPAYTISTLIRSFDRNTGELRLESKRPDDVAWISGSGNRTAFVEGTKAYPSDLVAREVCPDGVVGTAAGTRDLMWAVCTDGRVVAHDGVHGRHLASLDGQRAWITVDGDDHGVATASKDGLVVVFDAQGDEQFRRETTLQGVGHVLLTDRWVGVSSAAQGTRILARDGGAPMGHLPGDRRLAGLTDDTATTFSRPTLQSWSIADLSVDVFASGPGLTQTIADAEALVTTNGSGAVDRWRLTDGVRLAHNAWEEGVMKPGAIIGDRLYVGTMALPLEAHVVDTTNLEEVGLRTGSDGAPRT